MRALLVTDLDETLFGDMSATSRLLKLLALHSGELGLAVVTGRHHRSALQRLNAHRLDPACLVALSCSVGCEIYLEGGRKLAAEYSRRYEAGWSPDSVTSALEGLSQLTLQPSEYQRPMKISYFYRAESDFEFRVTERLAAAGHQVSCIFSQNKYLDIMPKGMSKGSAAEYIAAWVGLPLCSVMTAGDSGNDAAMLSGRCLGTVVGNYRAELEGLRGSPGIYFARERYADGIIEGLRHWGLVQGH